MYVVLMSVLLRLEVVQQEVLRNLFIREPLQLLLQAGVVVVDTCTQHLCLCCDLILQFGDTSQTIQMSPIQEHSNLK